MCSCVCDEVADVRHAGSQISTYDHCKYLVKSAGIAKVVTERRLREGEEEREREREKEREREREREGREGL